MCILHLKSKKLFSFEKTENPTWNAAVGFCDRYPHVNTSYWIFSTAHGFFSRVFCLLPSPGSGWDSRVGISDEQVWLKSVPGTAEEPGIGKDLLLVYTVVEKVEKERGNGRKRQPLSAWFFLKNVCVTIWEISKLISTLAVLICTLTNSETVFLFLYILSKICCQGFNNGHSNRGELVSQSSFNLCFSGLGILNTFKNGFHFFNCCYCLFVFWRQDFYVILAVLELAL